MLELTYLFLSLNFQPIIPRYNNKLAIHTTFLAHKLSSKTIPENVTYFSLRELMAHSHGSDDIECIFEYRPTKYMFGSTNYGDIPNIFNAADDCGWDIIAPGYEKFETGTNFKISSIYNILVLQNGNHKLAVKIQCEKKISAEKAKKEMKLFAKTYRKYTSVRCKWLYSLD